MTSMEAHRRAESWMAAMDIFAAQGHDDVSRWCAKRAAIAEEQTVQLLREEFPLGGRQQTIRIVEQSAAALRYRSEPEEEQLYEIAITFYAKETPAKLFAQAVEKAFGTEDTNGIRSIEYSLNTRPDC